MSYEKAKRAKKLLLQNYARAHDASVVGNTPMQAHERKTSPPLGQTNCGNISIYNVFCYVFDM